MNAQEYYMTDSEYEEQLTEIYGTVKICGLEYSAGHALREIDPTAFRCGIADSMRWKCDECGEIFDDQDDAEECCQEESEE